MQLISILNVGAALAAISVMQSANRGQGRSYKYLL